MIKLYDDKHQDVDVDDEGDNDDEDEEDLTDVTLVSVDTYWRLDWCYSSNWGSYQMMKVIKWWKLSSDESYQKWWKLSSDENYQAKKIIKWWKLSSVKS